MRSAILLALLATCWCVDASRYFKSGGTVTSDLTIPTSVNVVEIHDVTFSGGIAVYLTVASMSSTTSPVWITFCNCIFQNGAALYFDGDASVVDTKKPVYINLEGLTFISGGLGIEGYYPPATRIVIAHANVQINSRSSLLPRWNPFSGSGDGRFAYWGAWYNLYLRKESSILITDSFFGGTWPSGSGSNAHASFPINFINVNLFDRSSIWIRSSTTSKVFLLHSHGNFIASTLSTLIFDNMTMICDRFCMSFTEGQLTFSDRSAFVMQDSTASVPLGEEGEDLFMSSANPSQWTSNSLFLIKNNQLSPYRYAFNFIGVNCQISASIVSFYKNSVAGTPWQMTIATSSGGLAIAQCNDLGGAEIRRIDQYQTAGLNGLTDAYSCPRASQPCPYTNASCFMPGTASMSTSCVCTCNAIGKGPNCLATIRPIYKNQCLETASAVPTVTQTMTITDAQSKSVTVEHGTATDKSSNSKSVTQTERVSATATYNGTVSVNQRNADSNTKQVSVTQTRLQTAETTSTMTASPESTKTRSLSTSGSTSVTPSASNEATLTITLRSTNSRSREVSVTNSMTSSPSGTHDASPSRSLSTTSSVSVSSAVTKSSTSSPTQTSQTFTSTVTVIPPVTDTVNLISISWPATHTQTFVTTPTDTYSNSASRSVSLTRSLTSSGSGSVSEFKSLTSTRTVTITTSTTRDVSSSATETATPSLSNSSGETISRTKSITRSRSECDWFELGLNPKPPLVMSGGNNTMSIDYLSALERGEQFNITGMGQWYIIKTAFVGESSGVNQTTSPDGTSSDVVSLKIPSFYSPETERQVVIELTFRCGVVNHREFYTIIIQPLPPVLSAADIETLIRLTSLASVLAVSPAAAAAAALSLIMQQIMLCRPLYENSAVSLAGLSIGEGDPRYLRGALATNALAVIAEAAIVMLFAASIIVYTKSRLNSMRFWRVMEMLQWPSVMHISISALLQLSTTAGVSLIGIAETVEDGVAAVIAIGCCFSYTAWITRQVYVMHKRETGSSRKWDVAQGLTTHGFVFGDYSKAWFVAFETAVFFAVGLVAGIPPSLDVCLAQMFFIFLASLLVIAMLVWHRPYKTLIGLIFACVVHGFIAMAGMALVIGHYTRDPQGPYTVAALCLLFIPVAALLRGSWDIFAVCRNAKAWWGRATTAECLKDMPWDENDDEYEDANSSEDEEMLNFGVAAPAASLLEAPLLQEEIPKLPPVKKKKGKASSAQPPGVANIGDEGDLNDLLASMDQPDPQKAAHSTDAVAIDLDDLSPPADVREAKPPRGRDAPGSGDMDDLISGLLREE